MEDLDLEPEKPVVHRRRKAPWPPMLLIALVAVVLATVIYFAFFRRGAEEPADAAPAGQRLATSEEPSEAPAEPFGPLPALDESDGLVQTLARDLSAHPLLAEWLATDRLIRRFAVVVDNVAEGVSPRTHIRALGPGEPFQALERGDSYFIDPRSYRRYDELSSLVASLDARGCAELYRRLEPLVQKAYRDLGYPGRHFDDSLKRAIDRLLATPIVEGPVALTPKVSAFEYADPSLEELSEAQKHLLRMGPENTRKIQSKLRELRSALAL